MSNLKKGSSAILDQILFSGCNFVLNIYLAKYLSNVDYGMFAILYSIYLLFLGIFIAVLLEPYIFYKNSLEDHVIYTRLYAKLFNLFGLVSLILFLIGMVLQLYLYIYIAYILITISIYFYKRHFYAILKPKSSLRISIVYCLLMFIGFALFIFALQKNLFWSFSMLYVSSFLSLLPLIIIKKEFRTLLQYKDLFYLKTFLRSQFMYSKSSFFSYCFSWVPTNFYFLLIPYFLSNTANANFKALQNLNLPIVHINLAIGGLMVPLLLKSSNKAQLIKHLQLGFIGFTIIYCAVILVCKDYIEVYFYSNKYSFNYLILGAFILSMIPETISNVYKSYFKSIEKPNLITSINGKIALVSIILALISVRFGLIAIVASILITGITNLILSNLTYKKNENRNLGIIR